MGFSAKQAQILTFPRTNKTALICDGAVRSGKTSIMSISFILWIMREFNGQNFAFCGKSVQSVARNIIQPLLSVRYFPKYGYKLTFQVSKSLLTVEYKGKTNYIYVFGGKDESSYTLIQGITLAGVLLDEVVLMPQSFVNQALARCSVDGAKLWFSCNPDNPNHWFYKDWIKRHRERNALYLHFAMTDNPSLSDKTIARYESMYSGVFYQRYIQGLWVSAEGLVYQDFANNAEKYLIDDPLDWCLENNTRFTTIMIGVDFGGTGSATKFQATGITPRGVVVALDEEYIKGEVDPDALNREYSTFCKAITGKYGNAQTRADSAEQILIRGLFHTAQRENLGTQVKNALKMPINDRIMLTLLLMKQGRLFVSRSCPHLIEAFQTAVYDSKKFEDVRLDDGTTDIDSLDAFEYSIEPWYKQLEQYGFKR